MAAPETSQELSDVAAGFAAAAQVVKESEERAATQTKGTILVKDETAPIPYKEALRTLSREGPNREVLAKLEAEPAVTPAKGGLFSCFRPPKADSGRDVPGLKPGLRDEADLLLSWSKTHYQPAAQLLHLRMLRTAYKKLANSKVDLQPVSQQWEVLGFQGSDPCTDLNRSFGLLNVLLMLHFVTEQKELCAQVYAYSKVMNDDVNQNYPFAPTSINITRLVMGAFWSGALSSICNQRSSVHEVVAEVYVAAFWYVYDQFKSKRLSIHHFDGALKEADKLASTKPLELLKRYQAGVAVAKEALKTVVLDELDENAFGGRAKPHVVKKDQAKTDKRLAAYAAATGD